MFSTAITQNLKPVDIELIGKAFTRMRGEGVDDHTAAERIYDRWQANGNTLDTLTKSAGNNTPRHATG